MPIGKAWFAHGIIIRLFRRWAASRIVGGDPLGPMIAITAPLRIPDNAALTCASFFELVEIHLGRVLVPECCCSRVFSNDEKALIGIVASAPRPDALRVDDPSHGPPKDLCWSVTMLREAFGIADDEIGRAVSTDVERSSFWASDDRGKSFDGF